MNQTEKVLCIPRNRLPQSWVQEQSRVTMALDEFTRQCTASEFAFVDRPLAEKDPSLKQVIPYIVLQTMDQKKTAVYNRQGSEARLHDLWSLGIGGHINPQDQGQDMDFEQILTAGMDRELAEEVAQRPAGEEPIFKGIISEEITDVGKVHLGAVFQILTREPEAWLPGEELHLFQWVDTDSLGDRNLELWSDMALALLNS